MLLYILHKYLIKLFNKTVLKKTIYSYDSSETKAQFKPKAKGKE